MNQLSPQVNSLLKEWLSPAYIRLSNIKNLSTSFPTQKPFPFLELPNFFHPSKAAAILNALSGEKFYFKESDLFQFRQTHDFSSTSNLLLRQFRSFLSSPEFISYLNLLTGTRCLPRKIDMAGTLYEDTDFLLCHDDCLETRKIAYFYYLSSLNPDDGGELNLYASAKNKPTTIAATIRPQFNTFAFFLVSPKSFHQVEEIRTGAKRWAISGWFHDH